MSVDIALMPRCETCRYWRPDNPFLGKDDPGSCDLAETGGPSGPDPRTRAYAVGGEMESYLVTAPDFGCVQWEAKP